MSWIVILKDIVLPISSLVTAIVSIIIAVFALNSQKKHNQNSFLPILQVNLGDYENDIFVKIVNRGVGPAIVDQVKLLSSNKNYLIELFNDEECKSWTWTTFNMRFEGTAISPGSTFNMLSLEKPSQSQLDIIRKRLGNETIFISYHDIYNNNFRMSYKLDFFSRHFR